MVAEMGKKSVLLRFVYCAYVGFPSGQLGQYDSRPSSFPMTTESSEKRQILICFPSTF